VVEYLWVFRHVGFFSRRVRAKGDEIMGTTELIILIVVLLLLFGGGGGYYFSRRGR
jgi:hypothetical protein